VEDLRANVSQSGTTAAIPRSAIVLSLAPSLAGLPPLLSRWMLCAHGLLLLTTLAESLDVVCEQPVATDVIIVQHIFPQHFL
jgi:hypothetical protein